MSVAVVVPVPKPGPTGMAVSRVVVMGAGRGGNHAGDVIL